MRPGPDCDFGCDGKGALRVHEAECEGPLVCAMDGGLADCRGEVVDCPCTAKIENAGILRRGGSGIALGVHEAGAAKYEEG